MIQEHFDKNNLHHAYLIEGKKEEIIPDILKFLESIKIKTIGNPDFVQINQDSFKITNARILKIESIEKGISNNLPTGQAGKKVYIISINSFLIDAQNTLLKMFEEPIENTLFFLIVPDIAIILPTLLSRFYLIKTKNEDRNELKKAKEFINMSLSNRIIFIKDLVSKKDEEDDLENIINDSTRTNALKFLNAIEIVLHQKFLQEKNNTYIDKVNYFEQIFKVREFLSMPGSSIKSLMESIALIIPKI